MGATAIAVKERPILFNGEMVRAILEVRKSETRRLRGLKYINKTPDAWVPPVLDSSDGKWVFTREHGDAEQVRIRCPYGVPGDRLWVRENFCRCGCDACRSAWPARGPHEC